MKESSEMLGVAPASGVDKGAILGLIVGEWCSMRIKPRHWGEYEVRFRGDTAVKRVRYDHEGWDLRAVGASGWRGQVMETLLSSSDRGQAEELWHRQALAAYLGNDPGTHAAAAGAAWWLARRAVSLVENLEAYRLFLVANRIDPDLLDDVDRTWQERCRTAPANMKNVGKLAQVDAAVEAFFAARGEADKNGSPAGNPTLVFDDLAVAETRLGTYFYHLARKGSESQSLCGARSMATAMSRDQWGMRGHLNERYCEACVGMLPNQVALKLGSRTT